MSILRTAVLFSCALLAAGCLPAQPGDNTTNLSGLLASATSPQQVLGSFAPRPPATAEFFEVEINDSFEQPNPVTVDGAVRLMGNMTAGSNVEDRDTFDLGPMSPGDRVQADLSFDPGGDIVLALFDETQRIICYLDPSNSVTGPSHVEVVIPEIVSRLFAVVATRSGSSQARAYTVELSIARGGAVRVPEGQILVLSFLGAQDVRIGQRQPVDIPAFDAGRIDGRFSGQSAVIMYKVLTMVAEAYAGLGVAVYLSEDPAIPAGSRSTIYFGTYDSRLLGLADNIDPYNSNHVQEAVVFTDTFSVFRALSPDVEAISQVLANVASHEAGHLLGLRHTADVHDIMDTTASARQMLLPQTFRTALLNHTVISIGYQDAPAMLSWTVGGILQIPPSTSNKQIVRAKVIESASKGVDFYVPRWQLMSCPCPECGVEGTLPVSPGDVH